MSSQNQERGRNLLLLTHHSCCSVQAVMVWPAQLLDFSHLPCGPPWWNGMWAYLLPKQHRLWTRLLRAWTSWKLENPGIDMAQPLGLVAQLPHYHHWETVSVTCWNVVWCVLCRGGQSFILISELCPCLYVPAAAGCLCYQGTVHSIGFSRSLIGMLQVPGQTPAVLPPLGAGLWVGYSSLSLSIQSASYLSGLVELQSFLFLGHFSEYCVNS